MNAIPQRGQIIDRLQVEKGFEKALGAALADDLRAPEVDVDGPTGWAVLPAYGQDQQLPDGVTALSQHVSVPDVLGRRMGQIGLVDADDGNRLQPLLKPGQRLVSTEGAFGVGMGSAPGPKMPHPLPRCDCNN